MEEELSKELMIDEEQYESFRDIRKGAVAFGTYQKRLFIMMGFYWITASFFLILPFYFFKMPIYCQNIQTDNPSTCVRTCLFKQPARTIVPTNCARLILTISRIM